MNVFFDLCFQIYTFRNKASILEDLKEIYHGVPQTRMNKVLLIMQCLSLLANILTYGLGFYSVLNHSISSMKVFSYVLLPSGLG